MSTYKYNKFNKQEALEFVNETNPLYEKSNENIKKLYDLLKKHGFVNNIDMYYVFYDNDTPVVCFYIWFGDDTKNDIDIIFVDEVEKKKNIIEEFVNIIKNYFPDDDFFFKTRNSEFKKLIQKSNFVNRESYLNTLFWTFKF